MSNEPSDGDKRKARNEELLWKKKKIELVQRDSEKILETRELLKVWIRHSIDEYGSIPDNVRDRVDRVGSEVGVTVEDVIEEVMEEQVVDDRGRVDHNRLAVLLLQKAQSLREKNGGIMTLGEIKLVIDKSRPLSGKIDFDDIKESVHILAERRLIPGLKTLGSGLVIVFFLPVEVSPDQNDVLAIAGEKGWTTLEEVMVRTRWSRERAELALKELENSGISRPDLDYARGKKWYFPGLAK